jgi:hypothetical protein
MRSFFLSGFVLFFALIIVSESQSQSIRGTVSDEISGETLIGANVIYAAGKGVATDFDGNYELKLPPGEYDITISFVGYITVVKHIMLKESDLRLDVELGIETLNEVTVMADIAIDRKTPIAFSNISPKQIEQELAGQDLPMILNHTPGVYATQQGGGDGDARITIRGFNQRYVAVMIDGVPVNDMENGWVYWSNWSGLEVALQKTQVQRGLSATKIAVPSVGGSLNMITRGIDSKKSLSFRQDFGSFGYLRSIISYNSGRLKNGWGVTLAGSYKKRDGFVNQTWSKAFSYFVKVEKEIGAKHRLSLSAIGAPQEHGQRPYKLQAPFYSHKYASEIGVDQSLNNALPEFGMNYNEFVGGYLNNEYRFYGKQALPFPVVKYDSTAITKFGSYDYLNTRKNYFHKPQFNLKHSWSVNPRLFLLSTVYLSIGSGGGTGMIHGPESLNNGELDLQSVYLGNYFNESTQYPIAEYDPDDPYNFTTYVDGLGYTASNAMRSSINNHFWTGYIGQLNFAINENFTLAAGIDYRYYKGEHYREVYQMIGGDYVVDDGDNTTDKTLPKYVDDKIQYNDEAKISWIGGYAQMEYSSERFNAFLNLSGAGQSYQGIDYFRSKFLHLADTTIEVGYLPIVNDGDTLADENGIPYTVNYPGGNISDYKTDVVWHSGYTIKAGFGYNINLRNNVFINLGYLSKPPIFNSVISRDNNVIEGAENELIQAIELGYNYHSPKISFKGNLYYTKWNNKPENRTRRVEYPGNGSEYDSIPAGDQNTQIFIPTLDALHMGIEGEFAWYLTRKWTLELMFSIGDWTWQGRQTASYTYNENIIVDSIGNQLYYDFNPNGVHVGNSAQLQFGGFVKFEPINRLYIKLQTLYFGNNYSEFDATTLVDQNEGRDSWEIPEYMLFSVYAGYTFLIDNYRLKMNFAMLNLFNNDYVSDAQNNDPFATIPGTGFNANSATVFFGPPRSYNFTIILSF